MILDLIGDMITGADARGEYEITPAICDPLCLCVYHNNKPTAHIYEKPDLVGVLVLISPFTYGVFLHLADPDFQKKLFALFPSNTLCHSDAYSD